MKARKNKGVFFKSTFHFYHSCFMTEFDARQKEKVLLRMTQNKKDNIDMHSFLFLSPPLSKGGLICFAL